MNKKIKIIGLSVLVTLTATAQQEVLDKADFFDNKPVVNIQVSDGTGQYNSGWLTITDKLTDEQRMKLAGMEMQRYYKHHTTGMALSLGGSGLMVLGMYMTRNSTYVETTTYRPNPWSDVVTTSEVKTSYLKRDGGMFLTVVGGVTSLIGTIMVIEAPCHIKNAGLILSGNGVGLTIKI